MSENKRNFLVHGGILAMAGILFSVLAEKIIEQGGTVFGCALNEHCQAVHIGVDRLDELALLRGV